MELLNVAFVSMNSDSWQGEIEQVISSGCHDPSKLLLITSAAITFKPSERLFGVQCSSVTLYLRQTS